MPPLDTSSIAARAQSLVKQLPVRVVIGGTTYNAIRANLRQERAWQLYGAQESVAQSINLAVADLPTTFPLETLNLLTVDGKSLRFLGYEYDATRAFLRLDLKAVNS
jgi:hypothetical protein